MRTKKAVTHTVSFRLDEHLFGLLAEQAAKKETSPGDLARDLLRESLTDPLARRTLSRLAELRSQLSTLHQSMQRATCAILGELGRTEDEVNDFVNENMAERCG